MVQAVLFTYGNVLGGRGPSTSEIKRELELSHINYNRVKTALEEALPDYEKGDVSEGAFWARFANELRPYVIEPDFGSGSIWTKLGRNNKSSRNLYPWAYYLLEDLKSKGVKVALIENIVEPIANLNRAEGKYLIFDELFLSCDQRIASRKPERKIFDYAREKLNLPFSKMAFVDLEGPNIQAAKELGIKYIPFENTNQLKFDLEELCNRDIVPTTSED